MRVAVIGDAFSASSERGSIRSVPWDALASQTNIRDFDILIFNLVDHSWSVDWQEASQVVSDGTMAELLGSGGQIFVLGNPDFDIQIRTPSGSGPAPFLWWSSLEFHWDRAAGDSITLNCEGGFRRYLEHLKSWDRSFRTPTPRNRWSDLHGKHLPSTRALAGSRYGTHLAATISYPEHLGRQGKLHLLPDIGLPGEEGVNLVLSEICGLASRETLPSWADAVTVPHQSAVDEQIHLTVAAIIERKREWQELQDKRTEMRSVIEVLYERGAQLELRVRQLLRQMGGDVREPSEMGKEDGWLTFQDADHRLDGVLEIKGTKRDQFDETGLRQLFEWTARGEQAGLSYKGIFIGASAIATPPAARPPAFSASFLRTAQRYQFALLTTPQLFEAYGRIADGTLSVPSFWRQVFETAGAFELTDQV